MTRARLTRLWTVLPAILQTAFASAAAWIIATEAIGHDRPFLAVVSTIIALGLTYGQRSRRAVEIAAGVAVGVLVADLIVVGLGTGPLQIALVVGLAMAVAVVLGGTRLVVTQAATSAAIIATVVVPDRITLARFVDALVGAGVALTVNLVLFPVNPVRLARRAAEPLLNELAAALRDIAKALEDKDDDAIEDAVVRARGLEPLADSFTEAAAAGSETALWAPLRRRQRAAHARYGEAAAALQLAVNDVRVLARGARRAVDLGAHIPPETFAALRDLASAVVALAPSLEDPWRSERAQESALRAAGEATLGLEQTANLATSHIVGQVRSIAFDLLRTVGVDGPEARAAVRSAAVTVAAERES
ncbi:MAG TPA: FUSC family protein [Solirubrobacteraceae bacterium]